MLYQTPSPKFNQNCMHIVNMEFVMLENSEMRAIQQYLINIIGQKNNTRNLKTREQN